MKQLDRFEANLLRIVHGILQRAPLEKVLPLALAKLPRPPCLSRQVVELLQDTLAKGTVWLLARDGWRPERFVRAGQVRSGRLWQRTPPAELALTFSPHALDFLIWLTAFDRETAPPSSPADQLTCGDRLLFLLTYRLFRGTEVGTALYKWDALAADGLTRLLYADDFVKHRTGPEPHWTCWTNGTGSCILEAMQPALRRRWLDMEIAKGKLVDPGQMRALGQNQERTLAGFLASVNQATRWDLARFVLGAAADVLGDNPAPPRWLGSLKTTGLQLAERVDTNRAALAFVRQLLSLQQWTEHARSVGFFDEHYAASQLWKTDWEKHDGDELCRRAQALLDEVEPLKPKGEPR